MTLQNRLHARFISRLVATPEGRAHFLNQITDAEASGESEIFERVKKQIDDPQLAKIIDRHQADELRHEQLFRACVVRTGVTPGPVPSNLKIIDRIDRATGGFLSRPIVDQRGIMEAYLLLQVIEERAITQFGLFEEVFRELDPVVANTFAEVAKDEQRHLKYCHAIVRRYAPDETTRVATLQRFRRIEAECFRDNGRANMDYTFGRGLFSAGPVEKLFWRVAQRFAVLGQPPVTAFYRETAAPSLVAVTA